MKTIKKFLGYILIASVSFIVLHFIYNNTKAPSSISDTTAIKVTTEAPKMDCVKDETKLLFEASKDIEGRPEKTINLLADCIKETNNQQYLDLTKKARDIATKNNLTQAKLAEKSEKERKTKAKKNGIDIGYTAQQVLESSWGKPSQVNTTTNKYGSREQWVYRGQGKSGYVYLENGIVTSIQN